MSDCHFWGSWFSFRNRKKHEKNKNMVKNAHFITFHRLHQTVTFWGRYLASENVKIMLDGDTICCRRWWKRSTVVGDRDDLRSLATTTIRDRRFFSLRSRSLLVLNDPWSLKTAICGNDPRFTIVIDDQDQWSTILEKDGLSGLRAWGRSSVF